jgi:hypothetical protein
VGGALFGRPTDRLRRTPTIESTCTAPLTLRLSAVSALNSSPPKKNGGNCPGHAVDVTGYNFAERKRFGDRPRLTDCGLPHSGDYSHGDAIYPQ